MFLFSWYCRGQDPVFSQFYNAPLELNPAFAGNSYASTVALNYRNQWPLVQNVYQTYSASIDKYVDRYRSGLGLNLSTDSAGDGALKTTKISSFYAYRLPVKDDMYLKIGIEAGVINARLDWNKLFFPDQIDPEFGRVSPGGTPFPSFEVQPDKLSNNYFDVSSGLLLYNPLFFAGLSFKHLTSPDDSFLNGGNTFAGLPMRISFHGGFQINLEEGRNKKDEGAFITPNVLYVRQADFSQLTFGAYTSYRQLLVGAWYRHAFSNPDAVIASLGVRTGAVKISYSFDFTVSSLSIDTGGSHEIGILINMERVTQPPSKLNDCLSLFR